MNKQEAIESLQEEAQRACYRTGRRSVHIDKIVELVNQIDEPQKVKVPKFVGEWIDTLDEHGLFGLNYDVVDESVWNWVYENYDCNVKKLHLAYLYGYEIEQEKLYTVEIPDPHGMYKIRYLFRNSVGNIRIGGNDYRNTFFNVEKHLTESEIKQDFEWAWDAGFAKEVEEK